MKVAIHQPTYFPWAGLIDKISKCEKLIILDEVQLADRGYQHRTLLIDKNGKKKYLTLPFVRKGYRNFSIKDLKIADEIWNKKHIAFIYDNYKTHDFFDEVYPSIEQVFLCKSDYLIDIILASMESLLALLKIQTDILFQSEQDYDHQKAKSDLIIDLLKASGASTYLSGTGAMAYQNEQQFNKSNILIKYNFYEPIEYKQKNSSNFICGLSTLDMLFNTGAHHTREVLNDLGQQKTI